MARRPASTLAAPRARAAVALLVALTALLVLPALAGAKVLRGTAGGDRIVGTRSADRIHARGGADRIQARGGADLVHAGAGNDRVDGGAGDDVLRGGAGDDRITGGPGDDLIVGGAGRDVLSGGAGRDHLVADDGRRDIISCGPGWDVVEFDRFDVVRADCEIPRRVRVTITGSGTGVVRDRVSGVACPPECRGDRRHGTVLELVAEPDEGSVFAGWSGSCAAGAPTCRVVLRDDVAVTAHFVLRQVPVAVSLGGAGSGRVTSVPGLVDCGALCSATVGWGTTLAFAAHPAPGHVFAHWGGACAVQPTWVCVVQAHGPLSVYAAFTPAVVQAPATHGVQVAVSAGGRVVSEPAAIVCQGPATCTAELPAGAEVVLRPEPDEGYRLAAWSGVCAPAVGACRIASLDGDLEVAAEFEPIPPPRLEILTEGDPPPWWLITDDSEPARIACPLVCAATYERGQRVRLSWSSPWRVRVEEGCTGPRQHGLIGWCELVLDGDAAVRLRFVRGDDD